MRIFIYISKARTGFTHCFWVLWTTWSAAPGYTSLWLRVPATSWSRLTSTKVHCNPWEKALSNCQNESNCGTFLLNDVVTLSFCSCRSIVHEDSWEWKLQIKMHPKLLKIRLLRMELPSLWSCYDIEHRLGYQKDAAIQTMVPRFHFYPFPTSKCCHGTSMVNRT